MARPGEEFGARCPTDNISVKSVTSITSVGLGARYGCSYGRGTGNSPCKYNGLDHVALRVCILLSWPPRWRGGRDSAESNVSRLIRCCYVSTENSLEFRLVRRKIPMTDTAHRSKDADYGAPSVQPPNEYPTNGRHLRSTEPYVSSGPDAGLADWEQEAFAEHPLD